jgi:hemolysin III
MSELVVGDEEIDSGDEEIDSVDEELSSAITSGVGILLSVIGMYFLLTRSIVTEDNWKIVTCIIYGLSLMISSICSTLYHGLTNKHGKSVMRRIDQIGIYILIAGSYTPFVLVLIGGDWGWFMFTLVWSFALIGITILLMKKQLPDYVSTLPYLAMGWAALLMLKPLIEYSLEYGWNCLIMVVVGGVFYSLGTIVYAKSWWAYNHAIWHLFVLAGGITHFVAVMYYVIPHPI